jgi:uncharacterized membrane protein
MDEFMLHPRVEFPLPEPSEIHNAADNVPVLNRRSGYIRYVDVGQLLQLARAYHIRVRVERRVGQFVPAGIPLLWVSRAERITGERSARLLATVDIGPSRTMQQDVEFGVIQLVDIALRAISPAVNDPSTAISCIDQLSRILIRWISRAPPRSHFFGPPHVLRVVIPWISPDGLFDTAFEQIRHYSAADIAVSLRLLRAFNDIASAARNEKVRLSLIERAHRVVDGCAARLPEYGLHELRQRLAFLEMPVTTEP